MDLQQVDVVEIEALKGGIDGVVYGCARQAALVGVVLELRQLLAVVDASQTWVLTYDAKAFGKDDELVAREVILLDRFADDLFGDAVGVDIGWNELSVSISF